ncbi:hypothetical protein G9A89_013432 [Geosiphon pyriformis]|nr:hypothetical protein G9A89_013432 [Geosiphon pyriformis]
MPPLYQKFPYQSITTGLDKASITSKINLILHRCSGRKDGNEHEDEKLRKVGIWGERKFMRIVVCLGISLRVMHVKALASIINEAID